MATAVQLSGVDFEFCGEVRRERLILPRTFMVAPRSEF